MSRTGAQLLTGFSAFIGDSWSSTTTSAGNSGGTTLTDTALRRFGDDTLRDFFFRPTGATNPYAIRRATGNASATGIVTVAPAFTAQTATSETYEMHRYDPAEKFSCLDEARLRVFKSLARTVYDDTTTADGISRVFPIPSTIRSGPVMVMEECPYAVDVPWNFLASPQGDATTSYTATGTTASTVDRDDSDLLIPRIRNTATKLVTAASQAATYTLPIANVANGLTAALGADRKMTYARWVYCTEASKVRLGMQDDTSLTNPTGYHGGGGWELLTFEKTIAGNNATTLSAVISIASTANASTIYVEDGWWYFGTAERVRDSLYAGIIPKRVRRDDTTQQVYLDWVPSRGRQLRFIGRDTLSALGTTIATQVTNTMEVDEENEQILYAEAARILFTRLGLNLSDFSAVAANIAQAERVKGEVTAEWAQQTVRAPIRGMWAR